MKSEDVNIALCKMLGVEDPEHVVAVDVSIRPDSLPEVRVKRFLRDLTLDTKAFNLTPRVDSIDVTCLEDAKPRRVMQSPWHVAAHRDKVGERFHIENRDGRMLAVAVREALTKNEAFLMAAAPLLGALLEEIVNDDSVDIYPSAIEGGAHTEVDFEDWAHRVRQALKWISEAHI